MGSGRIMDITKIQAAISDMPKQPVQGGKQYTMVAQRVEAFRKHIGAEAGIITELVHDDERRVLMKASIQTASGFTVATGYAEEIRGSNHINKGAAIENCETSAVGRALAVLGLHGGEFASINEIEKYERNVEHAHDQAVRNEREESLDRPGGHLGNSLPGGGGALESDTAPPLDDDLGDGWRAWILGMNQLIKSKTATYQLQKLGEQEHDNIRSLRQYNGQWADELTAHFDVRWEQLNNGER